MESYTPSIIQGSTLGVLCMASFPNPLPPCSSPWVYWGSGSAEGAGPSSRKLRSVRPAPASVGLSSPSLPQRNACPFHTERFRLPRATR